MTLSSTPLTTLPPSTVKVVSVQPCGDTRVCVTLELMVDVHRMAEIGGEMLAVAANGVLKKKKKASA
jgi:hypothetical protein